MAQATNTSAHARAGDRSLANHGGVARRVRISDEIFVGLVMIADALAIAAVAAAVFVVYLHGVVEESGADPLRYTAATLLGAGLTVHRLNSSGAYEFGELQNVRRQLRSMLTAWTATIVILIVAGFLLKLSDEFSRVWLVSWYVASAGSLVGIRFCAARVLRQWTTTGRYFRAAVVVGAGELGQRFVRWVVENPGAGMRIVGIFDDRLTRVANPVQGIPVLGSVRDLVEYGRRSPIDVVVIALPLSAERRILSLIGILRILPADIRLLSDSIGFRLRKYTISYAAGIPTINIANRPIAGWSLVAKRALDVTIASFALTMLLPVLAAIAVLVRLDSPGPVLFRQQRLGFNNNTFFIYKFRTMRVEATDTNAEKLVQRDDARVTRVGRILRRTSLDELPQLWNVLKGDMSLVGPRPHPLRAKAADRLYHEVVAEYAMRHRVRPGITGWAQVNGWRGETDTVEKIQKRVEHDLYYIDNWSIWFDIWILLLTLVKGMTGRNVY